PAHRLDGLDGALHVARLVQRHEHGRAGKQVGVCGPDLQPPSQLVQVGECAVAIPIETFGALHARTGGSANRRSSHAPAAAPTNCAAMNPGTSAGWMPANVSLNERPTVIAGLANEV